VPLAEHARSVAPALQRLGSRTSDAGTFCTQSLGVRTSVPDAVVDPPMKSEIPCRATDLPVISDAREGEHTGADAYALRKVTPSEASRSMLGVSYTRLPVGLATGSICQSATPMSSTKKTTTFGWAGDASANTVPARTVEP
jgi:hypothetical protein